MEQRYKNKLKKAFQTGNFLETVAHAFVKRWPVQFIANPGVLELQMQDRAYRKLEKKYRKIIKCASYKKQRDEKELKKIIWWCWLQGVENAPLLVKKCYDSLVLNMKDYDIRVITYDNLCEYTELPEYVYEKYKKGWITAANFSDMIRMDILSRNGGIWIDSTVLCTGNWLNPVIENSPLFFFQDTMSLTRTIAGSSWLIAAHANNPVICMTRDLMFEYWKNNKVAIHYYLVHLFFTMALQEFPEMKQSVPVYNNSSPHILVNELSFNYDEERWEAITRMSQFHKLNYKKQYNTSDGTLYSQLFLREEEEGHARYR